MGFHPMNYRIVFSPDFDKDMSLLYEDIISISADKNIADNYIREILIKVNELGGYPKSGRKLYLDDYTDTGYRYIKYKKYLIFYTIIMKSYM